MSSERRDAFFDLLVLPAVLIGAGWMGWRWLRAKLPDMGGR